MPESLCSEVLQVAPAAATGAPPAKAEPPSGYPAAGKPAPPEEPFIETVAAGWQSESEAESVWGSSLSRELEKSIIRCQRRS